MTDTKVKSPSTLKRDQLRMAEFNLRKLKENYAIEIQKKTSTIFKLEVDISNLKFKLFKHRPRLTIQKVVNHEIPSEKTLLKPKQQLSITLTSNTCDTPSCQSRRRPCHAFTPDSQFYHDFI